ncbi:MAG: Gfo/Idh/MocA family oxidoreductase [Bacteroidales bacterium]|nr:Gfo/Idh/MocA family oxidoreductase [Bacteroidales bacterium]
MLKIGVLGAGHLGKIHIRCLQGLSDIYELVGFYDIDQEISKQVEKEFSIKSFSSADELIDAVDVVDIVTPTITHFENAARSIRKFKHVFIEKPVVTTLQEAEELIELAKEAQVKIQVGHVERFNPGFFAAKPYLKNPLFIEAHRLSKFNPRGTDVPVVLDLMIHDLDIVLHVIRAQVRKVSAAGVAIVSNTPDIANARIEFDNGAVANLTASRISLKQMRKIRFFQPEAYISVDFLEKKCEVVRLLNSEEEINYDKERAMMLEFPKNDEEKIKILMEYPEVKEINAIQTELTFFYRSIAYDEEPPVTIWDGYKALKVAHQIMEVIQKNHEHFG